MGRVVELATNENLVAIERDYAYKLLINNDLDGCIAACDFLLKLPARDESSRKEVRSFSLTNQATCYKKKGEFGKALDKVEEAKQDCCKDDYYKAIFTEALIHKAMGNKNKTVECLDSCIKWHKKNEMYYELAKDLDVKADLLKSEELFHESIYNYGLAEKEADWSHINKEKFEKEVNNVWHRLIDLYIYNAEENMIKAYTALNKITNSKAKEEALSKIKNLFRKEV